ncbi:hypothetical protein OHB41_20850 [Streptomyces sp. NBC_01571]|uniref:hypothetical protein n=1 Tax=Streptomyces sp. NBC_01571 TaxID=2975883 RepID=UPI0022517C18|nr:hypothetical protein [Streptomyces sp. NBC_01571]MCX4575592.1 hypothetical protein [Streptomyces sp. NBC_01571]
MPTTRLHTSAGCTLQDAGADWDAIRVTRSTGLTVMEILGSRCGAVVDDPVTTSLYFFVRVGTAEVWDVDTTRPLGEGSTVAIPPTRRTEGPGPHWRMCPGEDRWLTDADALKAALEDGLASPRPRLGAEHFG